jgi:Rieske Fe-S protein
VSKLPTAPAGAPEENTTETFHSVHLGKTSAIPVGGGVVYRKQGVVVTQPTAGVYQCFSASCTHLGCVVAKVAAGLIQCPCHGARFSIVDGSVKAGPAPRGLTRQGFSVQDGVIELD